MTTRTPVADDDGVRFVSVARELTGVSIGRGGV